MLFAAKIIIAYFITINGSTFLAFYLDKKAAMAGRRRIPERILLLLALLGGSPFAIVATKRLRHKTVKKPFKSILLAIIILQAILMFIILYLLISLFESF